MTQPDSKDIEAAEKYASEFASTGDQTVARLAYAEGLKAAREAKPRLSDPTKEMSIDQLKELRSIFAKLSRDCTDFIGDRLVGAE